MGSGVDISAGLLEKSRCSSRGVLGGSATLVSTSSCLVSWWSHMKPSARAWPLQMSQTHLMGDLNRPSTPSLPPRTTTVHHSVSDEGPWL